MPIPSIQSKLIGSGQPIILLHAFPLSHRIWSDIQPPTGHSFILPDFPGFGVSPIASNGLTLKDAAEGLAKHLEKSGIKAPYLLGGISMGGYWALEFVRQFPEKVQELILISTKSGVDKPENRMKRLEIASKVEKEGTGFLVESMIPGLLGRKTRENNKALVETVSQWICATDPKAVALAQSAMADRRDQTELLAQIKSRTLILAGAEDSLIPAAEAELMAKQMPRAKLKILEDVGHLIPLENPHGFEKILSEFFTNQI